MANKTIAALLCLGLCACGDSGSTPERQVTKVEMANPISDQLKGGNDLFRSIGLRRAIVDSGHRCKNVDAGGFQQSFKNYALWTAHCSDSGDWAVFIAPAGEAEARRCTDMATLKLPSCTTAPALKTGIGAKPAAKTRPEPVQR
jgi:hypothetical protein